MRKNKATQDRRLDIRISADELRKLDLMAEELDEKRSEVVRTALKVYFDLMFRNRDIS